MAPMRIGTTNWLLRAKPWRAFLVLAACGLALAAYGQPQNPPPKPPSRPTVHAAPASEMPLINLDGYRKLIADHHGKPLLVTFWATWCEPCREEYPLVNQLAKEYAAQGLLVV